MKRRSFLKRGVSSLAVIASGAGLGKGAGAASDSQEAEKKSGAVPARLGTYYERTVPDTLDLAERARLGLHYFDSITDASLNYEMYFGAHFDTHPSSMYAHVTSLGACQEKAL